MLLMIWLVIEKEDITAAFIHESLDEGEEIYFDMPRVFLKNGKVYKLKISQCGLGQRLRTFLKYLCENMNACELKQSKVGPYIFIG